MTLASRPEPFDWLAGLLRGLHPFRWLLCVVGVAFSALSAVLAESIITQSSPDLTGWADQPVEHAQALWGEIAGGSLGRMIVRAGPLLAVNTAVWCLIGGWVARHELLARRKRREETAELPLEPGPTAFVVGWSKRLLTCCPVVLILALVLLAPVLIAGKLNTWFGGGGALFVAVSLPLVLVANLGFLLIGLGATAAWPLMPVAVAAECSDQLDGLSRSYNYFFQRPVLFLVLTGLALGLAGLPLGLLSFYDESMAPWPPAGRLTVWLLAAGLSASIFWSLESLVYLHLRSVIDGTDAGEVAFGPPKAATPLKSPASNAAVDGATGDTGAGGQIRWKWTIHAFVGVVATWCLTVWLFTRASGGPAEWLGWGMSETIVPPAEGIYRVASVIAGLWAAFWVALPMIQAVRRWRG